MGRGGSGLGSSGSRLRAAHWRLRPALRPLGSSRRSSLVPPRLRHGKVGAKRAPEGPRQAGLHVGGDSRGGADSLCPPTCGKPRPLRPSQALQLRAQVSGVSGPSRAHRNGLTCWGRLLFNGLSLWRGSLPAAEGGGYDLHSSFIYSFTLSTNICLAFTIYRAPFKAFKMQQGTKQDTCPSGADILMRGSGDKYNYKGNYIAERECGSRPRGAAGGAGYFPIPPTFSQRFNGLSEFKTACATLVDSLLQGECGSVEKLKCTFF